MGDTAEPLSELKRSIGLRLSVLARQMRNHFDRKVSSLGVTRSQWTMIAVVGRKPGVTQRAIAEGLEISEASAGRLVDRLCADGLLERRERDGDRRARAIYLTPAAEPLLAQIGVVAKSSEEVVFKGFSDEELASLQDYLDRIYKNVARDC